MSQIPGINGCHDGRAVGSNKPLFRDTDSNYVRLAKQGGMKGLLNYEEPDQPKKAVGYARNDWFYLEDNAIEDARNKQDANWKFGVPNYMANASRNLESGDQTDCLQKMEALKMDDNVQTQGDLIRSPQPVQQLSNPPMNYNYPIASDRRSDQTVNTPEIKSDRSHSQTYPAHHNIERVKAVVPEQEYKNPILQNDYYIQPEGINRKPGLDRVDSNTSNPLPAGFTRSNPLPAGFTKKHSNDRGGTEVSMSKLLSHDYGKEWHVHHKDTKFGPRSSPFGTTPEHDFQEENDKTTTRRDKSENEGSNRKINFIDNGRSMNDVEKSGSNAAQESSQPWAVGYDVAPNQRLQ